MNTKTFSFPSPEEIENLKQYILSEKHKNKKQLRRAVREWLFAHWDNKLLYEVNWLGIPIIQTPNDMIIMQEIIYDVRPDFVVEMGVAHGGSVVYYASILELLGHGRVIGVDIDIRAHNRKLLDTHPMIKRIDLVEGDSVIPHTVDIVRRKIPKNSRVILVLDSYHERDHVLREMELYGPLVSKGSYMVVCDTITNVVAGRKHSKEFYARRGPKQAVKAFLKTHPEFIQDRKREKLYFTYFPGGFLKRIT